MHKGLLIVAVALSATAAASPALAEGMCAWGAKQLTVEGPKSPTPSTTAQSGPTSVAPTGG